MSTKLSRATCWLVIVSVSSFFIGTLMAFQTVDRPDAWKKVKEATNQGLPKSAIETLQSIRASALSDKQYGEAAKAIGMRCVLESSIEGYRPEVTIRSLSKEIETAPKELLPILHTLQGHFYWNYFEQNRWQFSQRTATSRSPGDDFTTWDLKRLFQEIDFHYSKSLEFEEALRAIPIATYEPLLSKGALSDAYRPTLFDFVAFEALEFYATGEQAGAKSEDAFEIEASSPALGSLADFLIWQPSTTDSDSVSLKAIRLYQKLLRIHQADADPSAYLDAELGRLQFCHANAIGEEKTDRYLAALKSFAETNSKHELSAIARHRWATILVGRSDRVQAKEIAQQGLNAFPDSVGGKLCANLIAEIESKSLAATTERVWSTPRSPIQVSYRNLNKVYFRLYSQDWVAQIRKGRSSPAYPTGEEKNLLKLLSPTHAWSSDLPSTEDYEVSTFDVMPPDGIKPGFYKLFTSAKEDFSGGDNMVSVATVWVSTLGLVMEQNSNEGKVEGFVVDNVLGTPIAGANVRVFQFVQGSNQIKETPVQTDQQARFSLVAPNQAVIVLAEHKGQSLASQDVIYSGEKQPAQPATHQFAFFTDRSLYRPGQPVSFKGVCFLADTVANKYSTVANLPVRVSLQDMNGQEVEVKDLKTNDFGSFSGSVQTPRDRGTGPMSWVVNGQHVAGIQIEEYKRPKFEVQLEAPKQSPKLNDTVTLVGKALSYTGMPIQSAKVKFRVARTVLWPYWFRSCFPWRMPINQGEAQEIAHGTLLTSADGTFQVTFPAKPDRSVPEEDNPHFHYEVVADVTDTTGETRSATSTVQVGYVAMQITTSVPEWSTTNEPVKLSLKTSSLGDQPVQATGKVKIFSLKQPSEIVRSNLLGTPRPAVRVGLSSRRRPGKPAPQPIPMIHPSDPNQLATWETDAVVEERNFETNEQGATELPWKLGKGAYRAIVESQDRFGKPVTSQLNFTVIDENASTFGLKVPSQLIAPKWSLEPGETWKAVWGTGYEKGQAYFEVSMGDRVLQSFWSKQDRTQTNLEIPITEEMRGGLTLRVLFVRENRFYLEHRPIEVPWTNKQLTVKTERMVSKLEPGSKKTFRLTVSGPKASQVVAEMVAGMYDSSLDAYLPHNWMQRFSNFRNNQRWSHWVFSNFAGMVQHIDGSFLSKTLSIQASYRDFTPELALNRLPRMMTGRGRSFGGEGGSMGPGGPPMAGMQLDAAGEASFGFGGGGGMPAMSKLSVSPMDGALMEGLATPAPAAPNLGNVTPRKNLQETAFFFPHVLAKPDGSFSLEFTMPEALTTWRFMAFAHDTELKSGYFESKVVTSKDIMVQPNPPRFLREGDILDFTVKVSNSSKEPQKGVVALKLFDVTGERSIDEQYSNRANEKSFSLEPGESRSYSWRIAVPDGAMPVVYKAIGGTQKTSDGEEGILPVLSKRILVTESLPLPIRGKQSKDFEFKKLLESANSDTIKHESLTVQMVSQPALYAVLALPYLMEYPHECSEQTFNRLYANLLARHIANSDPKIRSVFEAWKKVQPEALDSPLEKNQDLKSVMIEETPWLRSSRKESQARRDIAVLFDDSRLNAEVTKATNRLVEMQRESGMWPWFSGGPDSEYLSLYITTGFGRLRHLGVGIDMGPSLKSLARLDAWMTEKYQAILTNAKDPETNHLSATACLYLYGRSFFLNDQPIAEPNQVAFNYWKRQAQNHWLSQSRQNQAQLAIGLHRMQDEIVPNKIVKSILEYASSSEEMGIYWQDKEVSWWWYHAPIETQAILIEMLDEVAKNSKAVEECKVWLLKQKQTQAWKTTKSTADAIYALLLKGDNLLASNELVEVQLGGTTVKPEKVEAGTGFYEQKRLRSEVKPEFGKIRVTKSDAGVSWGSLHWQYLEDINKVTPYNGTPLSLEKKLFRKTQTKSGAELVPVDGPVEVGEELVCRIVLRTDRDMEFVHLKDHRGSGTEPVNVLSGYRFRDGLGYYESTRDTASHFFIDYLRKGTYVFEYSLRVQHSGKYPSGMASIQCMYAPEFNSHSASVLIEVSGKD